MKIKDIYERAVRKGMELDPRGEGEVKGELKRAKKEFEDLKEADKKWYDMARLENPYADTRVLYGDPEKDVKRMLVGIDMEVGEVVLADRLRERDGSLDLVLSHHPEGRAMANLYDVMGMQSGILLKYGVPINVAEGIMDERIREIERRLMPVNHTRAIDAARLLDLPFMCVHTPSDNAVANYLQGLFDEAGPVFVSEIVDMLKEIPEYKSSLDETIGPRVTCGSEKKRAGKVFVDMTGGTGGSKKAYERLSSAGVGTIVGMHMSEEHRKEAEKNHINVVIAGHIPSDNLGMNLMLDQVLDSDVEVVGTSGFRRIART